MLRGTKVLSGSISFDVEEDEFDEQTLFNAMKMLEGVIGDSFEHTEYSLSVRFPNVYTKNIEPVMNTDQLHSGTFKKGDSVDFYSHSKNLDIDMMMTHFIKKLERLVYPEEYANLRIRFNYNEFVFSKVASLIEVQKKKTEFRTIKVDEHENISIETDLYSEENFFDINYDEVKKHTNLFVFNDYSSAGISDMIDHLMSLCVLQDELDWFNGFSDKNVLTVAEILNAEYSSGSFDFSVAYITKLVIDGLADNTKEEHMIGTNKLLLYMEKASPQILRDVMREISFTNEY